MLSSKMNGTILKYSNDNCVEETNI
jgi:hypothetical protein